MYCKNCGKRLDDNALFCPECGTKISDRAEHKKEPDRERSSNVKEKRKSKKWIAVVGAVGVCLAICGTVGVFLSKKQDGNKAAGTKTEQNADGTIENNGNQDAGATVEFKDPLFENYVKKQLGKSLNDTVTTGELESLEELTIDHSFAYVATDYLVARENSDVSIQMSLEDLNKLPNLESLNIENEHSDWFYSLDSITECKKLKSLSFDYYLDNTMAYGSCGLMTPLRVAGGWGERQLFAILEGLPELKEFDPGHRYTQTILDRIHAISGMEDLKVKEYDKLAHKEEFVPAIYATETEDIDEDSLYLKVYSADEEMLEVIGSMEQLEYLDLIWADDDLDLAFLENLKNLNELSITSDSDYEDLEMLKELPNLRRLSLKAKKMIGSEIEKLDIDTLSSLENLTMLRLPAIYRADSLEFLENLSKLEVLEVAVNEDASWTGSTNESLSNLKQLTISGKEFSQEASFELPELELVSLILSDGVDMDFNGCPNLKEVLVSWGEAAAMDFSNFEELENVNTLSIVGRVNRVENLEVLGEMKNLKFLDVSPWDDECIEAITPILAENINERPLSYFATFGKRMGMSPKTIIEIPGYKELLEQGVYDGVFTAHLANCNESSYENYKEMFDVNY